MKKKQRTVKPQAKQQVKPQAARAKRDPVLAGLAILAVLVLTAYAYAPVAQSDFINLDDPDYVVENPVVRQGLTLEGVGWAFTTAHVSNWHPLTWISHMVDVQLFGLDSGAHHVVNLLFHLANTILLLMVLYKMSGAYWRSLMVAALFALHPLHVESVAWIAERKDVLSTFFFCLTLLFYVAYVRTLTAKHYLFALVSMALGLLSKSMLVTLPCLLLLLDYWPLRRYPTRRAKKGAPGFGKLLWEKLPFFGLSILFSITTFYTQKGAGAVASVSEFGFGQRVANVLTSYVSYAWKMFWPMELGVYYPIAQTPFVDALLAAAALSVITVAVIRLRKNAEYLFVGWFWYLGILVPAIGLVQVGGQAMADRYTYVPIVGLFIMLAWGLPELVKRYKYHAPVLAVACVVLLLALTGITHTQASYWQSGHTLYARTLSVTKKNFIIHYNWGKLLSDQGKTREALDQYDACLEASPTFFKALNNKAWLLATTDAAELRDGAQAVELAQKALQLVGKNNPFVLDTLAGALAEDGRYEDAARTAHKASMIAKAAGMAPMAREIRARAELYASGQPYRK